MGNPKEGLDTLCGAKPDLKTLSTPAIQVRHTAIQVRRQIFFFLLLNQDLDLKTWEWPSVARMKKSRMPRFCLIFIDLTSV